MFLSVKNLKIWDLNKFVIKIKMGVIILSIYFVYYKNIIQKNVDVSKPESNSQSAPV